nr:peroxidase 39 [Arachis hypogaea]
MWVCLRENCVIDDATGLGFHAKSCPKAEKIVSDFVNEHIHKAPSLAAGCDGSVLLNNTNKQVEKNASPNLTVRGFDFIEGIKSLVEAACPGVVSCANILTLATRDSIVATGGLFWQVPTGRRDGLVSNLSESTRNIPTPFDNFTTLQTKFNNARLDLNDLVILSGIYINK